MKGVNPGRRMWLKFISGAVWANRRMETLIDPDPNYPWIWLVRFGLLQKTGENEFGEWRVRVTGIGRLIGKLLRPLDRCWLERLAWGTEAAAYWKDDRERKAIKAEGDPIARVYDTLRPYMAETDPGLVELLDWLGNDENADRLISPEEFEKNKAEFRQKWEVSV